MKRTLLFFSQPNCAPCIPLYMRVVSDRPGWDQYAELVKINIFTADGGSLALKHDVKSVPTIVLLGTTGVLEGRAHNAREWQALLARIKLFGGEHE